MRLVYPLALILGLLPAMGKTLLLLPLGGDLEKASDLSTVGALYREAMTAAYKGDVHAPKDSAHRCDDKDCAVKLAQADKADEVVYSSVMRLGGKWVFSSTIVDKDGGNLFSQRGTAQNIEDLEPVTRRVADALAQRKSLEEVASTENIMGKEENGEPTRRRSLLITGFALGYLYPFGSSYSYLEPGAYNPVTFGYGPSTVNRPTQLIRLSWLNSWEFRDNLALNFDAVWSIPNDIGGDLSLDYLFKKTDFTPFLGGGLGLHYVGDRGDSSYSSSHRSSGPALLGQAGVMLFRTYDIHVIAKAQYQVILNSDMDNGLVLDVGLVYQKKERSSGGSGWSNFWMYYLLGALALSVIGAASH